MLFQDVIAVASSLSFQRCSDFILAFEELEEPLEAVEVHKQKRAWGQGVWFLGKLEAVKGCGFVDGKEAGWSSGDGPS